MAANEQSTDQVSRRALTHKVGPGTVIRHESGSVHVIGFRKQDDSGWWLEDHGGIADGSLTSGDWLYVADSVQALADLAERAVLSDIEARNPGIDIVAVLVDRADRARILPVPNDGAQGGDQA